MHSRAHLLIEKQFRRFMDDQPWGIEVNRVHEFSVFEWTAKIKALQGTVWEGGIFTVYIRFDEHYNTRPPYIQFSSIPFHPNVHPETGVPCVDFLDDPKRWNPEFSVTMILLTLQAMLSNPVWDNPVNLEAVKLYRNSPSAYRQIIFECVKNSQVREAGTFGIDVNETSSLLSRKVERMRDAAAGPPTASGKAVKLSFEDYYVTWCGIATSKSSVEMQNALLEKIKDNPVLQRIHIGLPESEIEEQINKQIKEHELTMYGRMFSKNAALEEKAAKMAQLQKMKKIYLPPRASPVPAAQEGGPGVEAGLAKEDTWEREADDLVAWTKNLDSTAIDA